MYLIPEQWRLGLAGGELLFHIMKSRLRCYRICPGRHMVWSELWITIASMLLTMNISKAVDENGIEIEPVEEWRSALNLSVPIYFTLILVDGVLSTLKNFACSVKPRSKQAEDLLRSVAFQEE